MIEIENFKKQKEYLVCVDSDGCAIDSMDIKHITCFGPCMVEVWNLFEWKEEILKRWNEINLYTITRGINRFKGLVIALKEINELYIRIEGLNALEEWVNTTKELSNDALNKYIEKNDNEILRKALAWSNLVNSSIKKIPSDKIAPFSNVDKALIKVEISIDLSLFFVIIFLAIGGVYVWQHLNGLMERYLQI